MRSKTIMKSKGFLFKKKSTKFIYGNAIVGFNKLKLKTFEWRIIKK